MSVTCLLAACAAPADRAGSGEASVYALIALPSTDHLGGLAREPMIVETSEGALFVSGYGTGQPALWRSRDGGSSWETVDVGTEADGAAGNSDVDLAVAPDGRIHFVAMAFDRQAFEGTGISIGSSSDGGVSWRWASLSRDRFDDRPWVEAAPDGRAHVIWNDGAGVSHATSADAGVTWTESERVHASGGSSHLAIARDGTIAVRLTPLSASGNRLDPSIDALAISTDGGDSWDVRELPGARTWSDSFDPAQAVLRWVEPVAWDSTGDLFTLWSEGTVVWLGQSADAGVTWNRWPIAEDTAMLYFPYLIAHGDGELAATWYSGFGDSLAANLAVIVVPDGTRAGPRVTRAEPFQFAAFGQRDEDAPLTRDTAGEYIPIAFLSDGRLAIVTTIQDPANDRWGFTFRPYRIERRSSVPPDGGRQPVRASGVIGGPSAHDFQSW
jgi:hypothetical protein